MPGIVNDSPDISSVKIQHDSYDVKILSNAFIRKAKILNINYTITVLIYLNIYQFPDQLILESFDTIWPNIQGLTNNQRHKTIQGQPVQNPCSYATWKYKCVAKRLIDRYDNLNTTDYQRPALKFMFDDVSGQKF